MGTEAERESEKAVTGAEQERGTGQAKQREKERDKDEEQRDGEEKTVMGCRTKMEELKNDNKEQQNSINSTHRF